MIVILTYRDRDGTIKAPDGIKGFDPYEVAVANGFSGSVSDWLENMVGGRAIDHETLDNSNNLATNKVIKAYIDNTMKRNNKEVTICHQL
jgi:bacillopeptidase F (M6 metalloprotease family)